jgi:hypothetical protein
MSSGTELYYLMDAFRVIAERKIREAISEGAFDGLKGAGKPLTIEDETWIPEDLRPVYRVLKNAGIVPPELELKKEILSLRTLIDGMDDNEERTRKIRDLNFRIMKFNMLRNSPLNLEQFPEYNEKFERRMIS